MRALFVWKKERNLSNCVKLCWEHKTLQEEKSYNWISEIMVEKLNFLE